MTNEFSIIGHVDITNEEDNNLTALPWDW